MNERTMVFSLPEGASVTLTLDGSATPEGSTRWKRRRR